MYAIIETGGKQYRVEEGDEIDVELLKVEENASVTFENVLFVDDGKTAHVGTPNADKFVVTGELIGETKGPKVKSIKYKRRKNSYRRIGHRQHYSRVKIKGINHVS